MRSRSSQVTTASQVLFIGLPASGKTTLYNTFFKPANYVHIVCQSH